jgi:hypothetical protein
MPRQGGAGAWLMSELVEGEDYYRDGEFIVFTRRFHLRRGSCCGSGCRHCPYEPRHARGATAVAAVAEAEGLVNPSPQPSPPAVA